MSAHTGKIITKCYFCLLGDQLSITNRRNLHKNFQFIEHKINTFVDDQRLY